MHALPKTLPVPCDLVGWWHAVVRRSTEDTGALFPVKEASDFSMGSLILVPSPWL